MIPGRMPVSAARRLLIAAMGLGLMTAACGAGTWGKASSPDHKAASTPESTPFEPAQPTAQTSSPAPATPRFHGSSAVIDDATRARMTASWHEGCPVPIEDLRMLTMDFWGFDGRIHRGEMVVNGKVSSDVLTVFGRLFDARFPIQRMELVDAYGADDDRSMAADNTSAFNCRSATGHPGVWSEHSYGWAIDIDPIQNPFVSSGGTVSPPAGSAYADRSRQSPGMIHAGDAVVRAFTAVGWGWGGSWSSVRDYQHFSLTGK
jgi:hypothetical protein